MEWYESHASKIQWLCDNIFRCDIIPGLIIIISSPQQQFVSANFLHYSYTECSCVYMIWLLGAKDDTITYLHELCVRNFHFIVEVKLQLYSPQKFVVL